MYNTGSIVLTVWTIAVNTVLRYLDIRTPDHCSQYCTALFGYQNSGPLQSIMYCVIWMSELRTIAVNTVLRYLDVIVQYMAKNSTYSILQLFSNPSNTHIVAFLVVHLKTDNNEFKNAILNILVLLISNNYTCPLNEICVCFYKS